MNKKLIVDILGSKNINNKSLIIIVNIPTKYLILIKKNIYEIDIKKIHKNIKEKYILNFIPIGQIKIIFKDQKNINILLVNYRIILNTKLYREIKKNIWIGFLNQGLDTYRSLGTIYSYYKPKKRIPIFPEFFLKKINYNYSEYNVYSDNSYGTWVLKKYMFKIDKKIKNLNNIVNKNKINNLSSFDYKDFNYPNINYKNENLNKINKNKKFILKQKKKPWFIEIIKNIKYSPNMFNYKKIKNKKIKNNNFINSICKKKYFIFYILFFLMIILKFILK